MFDVSSHTTLSGVRSHCRTGTMAHFRSHCSQPAQTLWVATSGSTTLANLNRLWTRARVALAPMTSTTWACGHFLYGNRFRECVPSQMGRKSCCCCDRRNVREQLSVRAARRHCNLCMRMLSVVSLAIRPSTKTLLVCYSLSSL